jgi:hypothetical protein
MKRRTDRAKPNSENTQGPNGVACTSELKIPSRENFELYFQEFYKMFQHCKYNLVALNKRFDAFEKFFKTEVSTNTSNNPISSFPGISSQIKDEIPTNFGDWGYKEEKPEKVKKPKKKNPPKKRKENDDDSFPISIQDLEYLAENFVSDSVTPHGKKESSNKKIKANFDVIVIDKKKMKVDEESSEMDLGDLDYFDDEICKNRLEENIVKPESFNQKLFDYKNFARSEETNLKNGNSHSHNTNLLTNKVSDDSKWLSKDNKTKEILLSNDLDIQNVLSPICRFR